MIEIDATRPDLAFVDAANAFAKNLQPLFFGKNAPRAGAKAFQDLSRFGRVQQDDAFDLRPESPHFPQDLGAMAGLIVEVVTDYSYVNGDARDGGHQFFGIRSGRDHLQAAIVSQRVGQELGVYPSAVGDYDTDKIRTHFFM